MSSPKSANAHELLPPLLACLPTSFISPRPPPALLPLLSPILRQRVTYLSSQTSSSRDGWLPLLSWGADPSSHLPSVVETMQIEPHPVSGEIEMDDVPSIRYRRLDEETLHARLEVEQFGLLPTYVWCDSDEHGHTGPGWKLTDLRTIEDFGDRSEWSDTILAANEASFTNAAQQAKVEGVRRPGMTNGTDVENGDDDEYWAAYDKIPSPTTDPNTAPAPSDPSRNNHLRQSQTDSDYYSRYEAVQPAMDAHDPDEADAASMAGGSTLQGNALFGHQAQQFREQQYSQQTMAQDDVPAHVEGVSTSLHHPDDPTTGISESRVILPTLPAASSVDKPEQVAANQSTAADERAQFGIKQHISTDIKSLYRLAKTVGMTRDDFTDVINRELEVLSIFDQDD